MTSDTFVQNSGSPRPPLFELSVHNPCCRFDAALGWDFMHEAATLTVLTREYQVKKEICCCHHGSPCASISQMMSLELKLWSLGFGLQGETPIQFCFFHPETRIIRRSCTACGFRKHKSATSSQVVLTAGAEGKPKQQKARELSLLVGLSVCHQAVS